MRISTHKKTANSIQFRGSADLMDSNLAFSLARHLIRSKVSEDKSTSWPNKSQWRSNGCVMRVLRFVIAASLWFYLISALLRVADEPFFSIILSFVFVFFLFISFNKNYFFFYKWFISVALESAYSFVFLRHWFTHNGFAIDLHNHEYAHRRDWSVRSIGIWVLWIAGGGILSVGKSKTIQIIRTTLITDDRIFHRRRHTSCTHATHFTFFIIRFSILCFWSAVLECGFASKRLGRGEMENVEQNHKIEI